MNHEDNNPHTPYDVLVPMTTREELEAGVTRASKMVDNIRLYSSTSCNYTHIVVAVQYNSSEIDKYFRMIIFFDQNTFVTDYEAELWLTKDTKYYFEVIVAAGSHLSINWTVEGDLTTGTPDECDTTGNYEGDIQQHLVGSTNITNDGTGPCHFPFRYMGILYYGCTYTDPTNFDEQFCATDVDHDYNAKKLAVCNEYCPRQR